jgi:Anti-sigma factor NepR
MTTTNKQENGPKICHPEPEPRVESEIECRLKAYYADILSQPIPDRLLQALKAAQEQGSVVKPDRQGHGGVLRGSIEAASPPRVLRRNAA